MPTENASYNNTVKRYTSDNTGWDYFVGGYAYGNTDFGYVVYLGGHSYADCKDAKDDKDKPEEEEIDPALNIHPVDIEFDQEITSEAFKLEVHYKWASIPYVETVSFTMAADFTLTVSATSGPGTP